MTLIQSKGNQQSSTLSISVTLDSSPAQGNLMVLCFKDNVAGSNITLPSGFVWTTDSPNTQVSGRTLGFASKIAGAGESATVTVTSDLSATKLLMVWEDSGHTDIGHTDEETGFGGGATSRQLTSSGTLPNADCFVAAVCDQSGSNGGEVSVDSGFTLRETGQFDLWMVADKTTTVNTALAPTFAWTTSRQSIGMIAAFPVGAAAGRRKRRVGGAWVTGTRKTRVGGAWVTPTGKRRVGGSWV